MIAVPNDRNWTMEEIEGFRPIVEAWTYDDVQSFYDASTHKGLALTNVALFHKVYKERVKNILLATPLEVLAKKGLESSKKV
jgi:hypothetical protein